MKELSDRYRPKEGEIYQHFKGVYYRILNTPIDADIDAPLLIEDSENEDENLDLVWYQCISGHMPNKQNKIYCRSLDNFIGDTLIDNEPVKRFVLIQDNNPIKNCIEDIKLIRPE